MSVIIDVADSSNKNCFPLESVQAPQRQRKALEAIVVKFYNEKGKTINTTNFARKFTNGEIPNVTVNRSTVTYKENGQTYSMSTTNNTDDIVELMVNMFNKTPRF